MPQVMELDPGQASAAERLAPPVSDGVLMRRVVVLASEEPLRLSGGTEVGDVLREQFDQAVGE